MSADLKVLLNQICDKYQIDILYVFGSRSEEIMTLINEKNKISNLSGSDVDIGVKISPRVNLSIEQKVLLTQELEELFCALRVDLVCLTEADPFLAAKIIRGERLYARDKYLADEYNLYVLRRAGDLAPLERERMALIVGARNDG